MRRTWVKFYCNQWLRGSIRKESIEVRAIFADLLAMAGDNAFGEDGMIQLADDVGFTDELISGVLNVQLKTWLSAKERLSNHPNPNENRIEIVPLSQGFSIRILNWQKYQSEYKRQRPYREGKKKEDSPPDQRHENEMKKERDLDIDEDEDIDEEEKVTRVTKKVTIENSHSQEESSNSITSSHSSSSEKEKFLKFLKECEGYPFDSLKDEILFDIVNIKYPKVDHLYQIKKKIKWWEKEARGAVEKRPRTQILDHFEKAFPCKKKKGELPINSDVLDNIFWLERSIRQEEEGG